MDFIVVLIGIVIAIVSAWYTIRSYRHSREINSKGAKLHVGLYSTDSPNNYYILLPFSETKAFFFPIVFSIANSGEISAKNVELFFTVTDDLYHRDGERTLSKIATSRGVKHASEKSRTKYLTDSYIKVGDIPPKTTFNVVDDFCWNKETIIRTPVEATSKDGVNLIVNILATIALILEVKIMYQDNEPIIRTFSIEFRKFGKNEKLNKFIKREEILLNKIRSEARGINQNKNTEYRRIRIVTFNKYKKFEELKDPQQEKDSKLRSFRCDVNTVKYIDGMISGNKIILLKKMDVRRNNSKTN